MGTNFLHGVEVVDDTSTTKTITIVSSNVIGVVGTAPNADPTVYPLNTPVLNNGSASLTKSLYSKSVSADNGTLPGALQDIFDIIGAVVVVVRVDVGTTDAQTQANIIAGAQQFVYANAALGQKPRILIAPGFTHQRTSAGIASLVASNAGAGYTDGTYPLTVTNATGDTTGAGAAATATVVAGVVTQVGTTAEGSGYTAAPTFKLPAAAGTPTTAAVFTATVGTVGNAVVAEMISIAARLRAIIVQDGPNTTDADAIAMAGDFDSERVYLVDPWVTKLDQATAQNITRPASPTIAGIIAWTDSTYGFWYSPSNKPLSPVLALGRPIDFTMGDASSGANLLNAANVATIIRMNGFRTWGNRTLSTDSALAFLAVVRSRDIINDSIAAANLWAVDQPITKGFVDTVLEEGNNFMRTLISLGAVLGGSFWLDPDENSNAQIAAGQIKFDYDQTVPSPAERVTFTSHLTDDYESNIF
ncbi:MULTISPECIES: phage tail sheath subtilisin-like domain-containing protein [unclassified Acidocella]|uniref:phage tail sheath subtilisin-like domain-containing protein n=1 Tax=unclassified Acidocella TaxID=2648610 RepID=UPI00028D2450|nr:MULTISPECIES: phage tail sheath subtilisin-like domain-containing protein [unclassified Acidocella]EKN00980.1 hypothetical protein MXAZACID_02445 [Acidocella sp. MX-AZ02]WBO60539.1 phage tail sheath subtilisin-like domain-containing protein [Acidocella sp. MX-AZ03]